MPVHDITTNAFNTVTGTHELVLLKFWATWCGPCRAFAPVFADISEHYPSIHFGAVDIEAEPAIAQRHGIRAVPSVLLLHRGEVVRRHTGGLKASALADLAETALARPRTQPRS